MLTAHLTYHCRVTGGGQGPEHVSLTASPRLNYVFILLMCLPKNIVRETQSLPGIRSLLMSFPVKGGAEV